jgi:phosphatidylserine/phosphatidylglycerophosphate/cardiolipin synthase-like enzyme
MREKNNLRSGLFFLALFTFGFVCANAPITTSADELIQSVPIETTLAVPSVAYTQPVWIALINSAQATIDLEHYYISNEAGQSLQPVIDALTAAAARGVRIRFLLDAGFYKSSPNEASDLENIANIQLKTVDYTSEGGIQHAKYMVVDGVDSCLGSANFDWLALTHIHEVGMQTTDAGVAAGLEAVFAKDWSMGQALAGSSFLEQPISSLAASVLPSKGNHGSGITLVASPPSTAVAGVADTLTEILKRINAAKASIKIQVYQYATQKYSGQGTWLNLDKALRAAAARGVQVQLMVDNVSMKAGGNALNSLARLQNFQVRTVTIPEWSGGPLAYARLIHSKYFVIDGATAWLGSENWSDTYFTGTRNVGVILETPAMAYFIGQLELIYNQVWTSAYTTTL